MKRNLIQQRFQEHQAVIDQLQSDEGLLVAIKQVAELMIACLNDGGGIYLCGNGGSAADAQHIAAELSGRFKMNRKPLRAEALHTNSSFVTAVGNDFGFDQIYARSIEALGRSGDLLIALSTSGKSVNVLNALNKAQELGIETVGMTGANNEMDSSCSICLKVPSIDTARIQEGHILIGHILCEIVESQIFGKKS